MSNELIHSVQQVLSTNSSEAGSSEHLLRRSDEEHDLWEYWLVICRHIKLIAGLFIVAELLTAIAVFIIATPLYTAVSSILIESQTPQVIEPNNNHPDPENVSSFYRTQYDVLQSRTLAARVIRTLGLDHDQHFVARPSLRTRLLSGLSSFMWLTSSKRRPASDSPKLAGVKTALIERYLAELTIRPEFETELVQVAFTSPDPVLAAKVANAHVRAYIRDGYERRSESNQAAQRFLEGELGQLEKRVEKSEAALNDYRRSRGIPSLSVDDKNEMIGDRIAGINKALVDAEESRIAIQSDVEAIRDNKYDQVPEVASDRLIQDLQAQIFKLEGRYANLSSQYTPEYPDVIRLHAQLLELKQREHLEVSRVISDMKAKYRAALDREASIRQQLKTEIASVMALNDASLRDAVLSREVQSNRALYKSVLERIKLLGLSSDADVTNVSIVDAASVPTAPSSPKAKLSLVLSGFLALMAGVAIAFMLESLDSGMKSADEVHQYLQLPNLATIPKFISAPRRRLLGIPRLFRRSRSDSDGNLGEERSGLVSLLEKANGTSDYNRDGSSLRQVPMLTAASEAYRTLRTSLMLSRAERPPRVVLFTSASPGEGKTLTAVNTAIAFASMVDRVLLIDADLRRPRCHELLNQESGSGLTEILTGFGGIKDAIQPTAIKNLYFLSAGANPPNPCELLGSRMMRDFLAAVRPLYDQIVIDSAPVLPVSDTIVLSTMVDGLVLVVSADAGKRFVREACHRILNLKTKILGVVLNNVDVGEQRYRTPYRGYP